MNSLLFAALLTLVPHNNMPLVEAEADGVACTLLVDTGASHTTLDLGFVTNRLPHATLHDIQLMGRTNVSSAPKFVEMSRLTVGGEMTFETEGVMALDLGHLSKVVGRRVDGILGMNHLREKTCIISLKNGEIVWNPTEEARALFRPLRVRDRGTTFEVLAITPGGRRLAFLVDTGSTFTFIDKNLWPAAEGDVKMGTGDVNAIAEMSFTKGETGEIDCGKDVKLTISPFLTPERNRNQIGSDFFLKTDILLDGPSISVLPR